MAFRVAGVLLWLARLRRTNGPNFTWPMMMFCSALPEEFMFRTGRLYPGKPMHVKTRAELLASVKPNYWKFASKC